MATAETVHKGAKIEALSFLVAFLIILLCAASTIWLFRVLKAPDLLAAAVGSSYFTAMLVNFISVSIPISVGAYRGGKYKAFYDLAYYSQRLDKGKRTEIDDFVTLMSTEYFGGDRPTNNALEAPSSASA